MENLDKNQNEYIGKIVQLAKLGIGGEKENAIRIVKKLCLKHNLDFDEVMNDKKIERFYLRHKQVDKRLAVQIIARYCLMKDSDSIYGNGVIGTFTGCDTTKEKFIEAENAYIILSAQYRKERRRTEEALYDAFISKHNLFYQPTDEEIKQEIKRLGKEPNEDEELTEEQRLEKRRKRMMASGLMDGLEDVTINKLLEN